MSLKLRLVYRSHSTQSPICSTRRFLYYRQKLCIDRAWFKSCVYLWSTGTSGDYNKLFIVCHEVIWAVPGGVLKSRASYQKSSPRWLLDALGTYRRSSQLHINFTTVYAIDSSSCCPPSTTLTLDTKVHKSDQEFSRHCWTYRRREQAYDCSLFIPFRVRLIPSPQTFIANIAWTLCVLVRRLLKMTILHTCMQGVSCFPCVLLLCLRLIVRVQAIAACRCHFHVLYDRVVIWELFRVKLASRCFLLL